MSWQVKRAFRIQIFDDPTLVKNFLEFIWQKSIEELTGTTSYRSSFEGWFPMSEEERVLRFLSDQPNTEEVIDDF